MLKLKDMLFKKIEPGLEIQELLVEIMLRVCVIELRLKRRLPGDRMSDRARNIPCSYHTP